MAHNGALRSLRAPAFASLRDGLRPGSLRAALFGAFQSRNGQLAFPNFETQRGGTVLLVPSRAAGYRGPPKSRKRPFGRHGRCWGMRPLGKKTPHMPREKVKVECQGQEWRPSALDLLTCVPCRPVITVRCRSYQGGQSAHRRRRHPRLRISPCEAARRVGYKGCTPSGAGGSGSRTRALLTVRRKQS